MQTTWHHSAGAFGPPPPQTGSPEDLKGDALAAMQAFRSEGGEIGEIDDAFVVEPSADLIVDAIFGTGCVAARAPDPLTKLTASQPPTLASSCPTPVSIAP